MSNSKLATYTRISPNCTRPRRGTIKNIIIHHMAGVLTVEQCGAIFANASRQASSNYGVDSSGRIGLYVDEANRAWTTGNPIDNDSVTIEVSNSRIGDPWPVSDKALEATIELCADICRRNGIKKLNYTGDKTGNLLMHRWYQATGCPGPYLGGKFPEIAKEVNRRIGSVQNDGTLTVDGYWGKDTTRATQRYFGTVVDGIVSRQPKRNQVYLPAATSGWDWQIAFFHGGSPMIRALQKKVGAQADGLMGPDTATKLQAYLGIKISGRLDNATVRAWQQFLNRKGGAKK